MPLILSLSFPICAIGHPSWPGFHSQQWGRALLISSELVDSMLAIPSVPPPIPSLSLDEVTQVVGTSKWGYLGLP